MHFLGKILVAEYMRLSREDGDKVESDSISNQRELITEYLSRHKELKFVSEYDNNDVAYTCTVVSKSDSGYVLITSNYVKTTKGVTFDVIKNDAEAVGARLPTYSSEYTIEREYIKNKTNNIDVPAWSDVTNKLVGLCKENGGMYTYAYSKNVTYYVYYAFDVPFD